MVYNTSQNTKTLIAYGFLFRIGIFFFTEAALIELDFMGLYCFIEPLSTDASKSGTGLSEFENVSAY